MTSSALSTTAPMTEPPEPWDALELKVDDMEVGYGYETESTNGPKVPWVSLQLPYKVVNASKPLCGTYRTSTKGDDERWVILEQSLEATSAPYIVTKDGQRERLPSGTFHLSRDGEGIKDDLDIVKRLPEELRRGFEQGLEWASEAGGTLILQRVHYPPETELLAGTSVPELQWYFAESRNGAISPPR